MTKIYKFQTLEEKMHILQKQIESVEAICIADILSILSGKGRPFLLLLVSLFFCQPLQIPGLSTPFGLLIAFIGLRMLFGKGIWLPKLLLIKKISTHTLQRVIEKTLSLTSKIKSWIHPRLNGVCHSMFMQKLHGVMFFILGVILALPLPIPFSNLIAAWSIFLIAFGILEDDGVFVLIGYLLSVITMIFMIVIGMQIKRGFENS